MEKLKFYAEKLEKIEKNCQICKSKVCYICPNNKNKKHLKAEIKKITGIEKKENFLKRFLKYRKD